MKRGGKGKAASGFNSQQNGGCAPISFSDSVAVSLTFMVIALTNVMVLH